MERNDPLFWLIMYISIYGSKEYELMQNVKKVVHMIISNIMVQCPIANILSVGPCE